MTRLLVVEDEAIVAKDISSRLERLGYDVIGTTPSGEEAVAITEKSKPDVILMDVHLQGTLDGVGAAEEIRKRYGVPVIFLTGHADDETFGRARNTAPAGYLAKPFEERTLQTLLELTIDKQLSDRRFKESQQLYQLTLQCIADAVLNTDKESRVTYMNPAAETLTGASAAEVLGKPIDLVLRLENDKTGDPVENPVLVALASGKTTSLPLHTVLVRNDSSYIPVDDCVSLLVDDSGEVRGTVVVFQDGSERRRAEDKRNQMEMHVQQLRKLESLGSFVGGIAHDFNNLLATILGYAEVTQLECANDVKLQNASQEIIEAALRGAELTRQMMYYAGRGAPALERVSLSRIVLDLSLFFKELKAGGIAIELELDPEVPAVNADVVQIRDVLANLVRNAVDSLGASGGKITIRTTMKDCDRNYLLGCYLGSEAMPGKFATLEVRDTGSGMPPETIEKIFDPFFTTKFAGRGLGLSATLGMVRGHTGLMRVESKPGVGSTFTVLLPLPANGSPATFKENSWEGTGTILLVDDDSSLRSMAKSMLEGLGFRVVTAKNGLEALEVYREQAESIDLALVDVTMALMDGPTTFRELRKLRPDVKVILISGYGPTEQLDQLKMEGLLEFLQKPFTSKRLNSVLQSALGPTASPR